MKIKGVIKEGLGLAGYTIYKQKPLFRERGLPGIDRMETKTLNLDISPFVFRILRYDYFFEDVECEPFGVESFGFIQIDKIVYQSEGFEKPGYIYIPILSPHFSRRSQIEVISVKIPGLKAGDVIELEVKDGKLDLETEK